MFNAYSAMKTKLKKQMDDNIHLAELTNIVLSMFEYQNLPETLPDWLIETMLMTEGTCGVCKIGDNLYTGTGGYCGEVVNFVPTDYMITNVGVGNKRGKIGTDFAVGWNNSTGTPDWLVMQTASILTEVDVSERCNLLFSRFLRIPKVHDSKEKAAVENAVKSIMQGKFEAMVSDNVLEKMIETGSADNKFLDLVDIKEVDKLQYLNQYRDNIVKRFYMYYGQGMQTTSKLAQQTTDEIHGTDTVAMINPLDRLKQRKKFVEDINKLFGTNISVDFSECWKDSRDEMQELYSDGNQDPTPTGDDDDNESENENQNSD